MGILIKKAAARACDCAAPIKKEPQLFQAGVPIKKGGDPNPDVIGVNRTIPKKKQPKAAL
ncbi:MAG: hypothetical protein CFE24_06850 [Flavobacterium sp. BFFFF2]|nr:MAG: hypothetical protein CFE24_06850 [Flavobacterium sp. BFFFF2]